MKIIRPLFIAVALAAFASPALAQGSATTTFETVLGQPRAFDNYPKPWPLKALVTAGKLTVGTTGAAPPRTFVDPASGKLTGSYVKLFELIAKDLGLEVEFVKLSWPGILPGLGANRFDLACDGASWSAERLGSGDFLMTAPTAINATVAIALKDAGIKSWGDSKGKRLGGVKGEIYFEGAKKELTAVASAVEFPGMTESILGLQNRQVDFIALNLSNAVHILETSPMKDRLEMVGPPLAIFPQSLCVNAREPDLLVAVNLLLGNYRANGTLKKLIAEYSPSTSEVDMLELMGY